MALCVVITTLQIGDAGVNAHLALLLTAPPASLFSLLLPNGTLLAVLSAGALGMAQWVVVAEFASRRLARRPGRGA